MTDKSGPALTPEQVIDAEIKHQFGLSEINPTVGEMLSYKLSAAGYVIVPKEPTEAQAKAAAAEVPLANVSVFGWMAGYRAMLTAGGHDDD